ncbi:MAG TPA: cohesin domain-containing protein [Candidatus Paceibacterota bacterium]
MKKITFSFLIVLIAWFCASAPATAATLVVTPPSASVTEGSTFSVSVRTDTQGQSVNVAEATVGFSTDTLEIVSVSPGATFTLQTPGSPSKTASTAYFSAGIPSGYNGSAGMLGRITFRAKKAGKATISVTSGKVLLNDGNATNALNGTSGSVITITPKPAVEPTTPIKEPETAVVPPSIETQPVVEMPIVVTPTPVPEPATTTIRTKDLFTLIYILIGIIFILLGVIIALIAVIAHRKPLPPVVRKPRAKKAKEEVRLSDI